MEKTLTNLRKLNFIAAGFHAISALLMFILSDTGVMVNVTGSYLTFDQASESLVPATTTLFDVPLVYLPIAFLLMSALAHTLIATVLYKKYKEGIRNNINTYRWIEYAFSASTMIVAIAALSGIYDIGTLAALFALTAGMNLMGLVMEKWNSPKQAVNWLPYWIGCLLGAVPWLVIGASFWFSEQYGSGNVPSFVYWIYVSIFLAFNSFAINMVLQYRGNGRWKTYVYGERVYIILSFVAKAALAWQVWGGTLRP